MNDTRGAYKTCMGEVLPNSELISATLAKFHSSLVSGLGILERSFGQGGVLGESHSGTEARQWGGVADSPERGQWQRD
jgi:hypothetical protein